MRGLFTSISTLCLAGILFSRASALPANTPISHLQRQLPATGLTHGLSGRTLPPGALWGDNDAPNPKDIEETTNPDIGLLSALCALVFQNPEWIRKLVTHPDDSATTTQVVVNLFDPISLVPRPVPVSKADLLAERSDAKEGWWVGAVEQAVRDLGYYQNFLPARALQMLTGRPATLCLPDTLFTDRKEKIINIDEAWEIIKEGPRQPLIFQTKSTGTKHLHASHAYSIIGGHGGFENGDKRWMTIYSPWGIRATWDLDVVWQDCYLIHGFENGDKEKP